MLSGEEKRKEEVQFFIDGRPFGFYKNNTDKGNAPAFFDKQGVIGIFVDSNNPEPQKRFHAEVLKPHKMGWRLLDNSWSDNLDYTVERAIDALPSIASADKRLNLIENLNISSDIKVYAAWKFLNCYK